MIACVLLNISKSNSGLKGIIINIILLLKRCFCAFYVHTNISKL